MRRLAFQLRPSALLAVLATADRFGFRDGAAALPTERDRVRILSGHLGRLSCEEFWVGLAEGDHVVLGAAAAHQAPRGDGRAAEDAGFRGRRRRRAC